MRFLFIAFLFISSGTFAQVSSSSPTSNPEIVLDPSKVVKFEKYCVFKHDLEPGGFLVWKANNPDLYLKEMWYYTESFYVKRDYLGQGITMDESMIDVSRFEKGRLATQETIVTFPGFKDVMVLLPKNKLIYRVK